MQPYRRNISTVAPQALYMLNHPFVIEQSRSAAKRLLEETDSADDQARINRLYSVTLGRSPSKAERLLAIDFLGTLKEDRTESWAQLFHALFASIDFRYVD